MTKQNKKLRFDIFSDVFIIDTFIDTTNSLWWSQTDLYNFKISCINEIHTLMRRHWQMNFKEAKKLLYQPGNMTIIYDEHNFSSF
jgi:hypothetical protein